MRIVVARKTLRSILKWIQRALLTVAAAAFGYGGFVLTDAWWFQRSERHQLNRIMGLQNATDTSKSTSDIKVLRVAAHDGLIGSIAIARVGLSAIVLEGDDPRTLRRGVGHIARTPLPGQQGNIGIAGHRDTFFRSLRNVKLNDVVIFETIAGEYRYRIVSTRVVKPTEVSVLNPGENETLTLITCYPFYFVGSAPNRFIVRAERIM